ncbi:alpha/beta fold hydrolase [Brevibacillus dissolubilis]|uniref:alpha/beta fold hydrolase n=1 Tax=Brevibacillus dissolubilis TaxID=1844116 RepID=UPI0011175174|nr:alpha/beta hydrolase [Brevibacillus dissolubilis]
MQQINLTLGDQTVNGYLWSNPDKPVILCIHGLTGSAASFFELAELLQDEYHLVALDMPGHGLTPGFSTENSYLFTTLAAWLDGVVTVLGLTQFTLMGHSWGAALSLFYAAAYPDKVTGLIMLDGGFVAPQDRPHDSLERSLREWDEYLGSFRCATWKEAIARYSAFSFRWNDRLDDMTRDSMQETAEGIQLIVTKETLLAIMKSFYQEPFRRVYDRVSAPILLVRGTMPPTMELARENGVNLLKSHHPDAVCVAIENTGHMVHWDAPERVADEVKNWLKR